MKKCVLLVCLMLNAAGFCQEWNVDLETAKSKAIAQNKNILLVFSGSDWCSRCIELERKVWQSEEFKTEADKNWILLRADFLQKKGESEPVDINDPKIILTERYNRNGFFPYIVLLDKYGRVIERDGYEQFNTAKEYIEYFKKLGKK
ncbi:thioredoxin family protein [Flavobacterium beibuense]|uniref:Thiol-disulfide isomerase n=1 Tax=Flavobacterium beibuense F44-8 TaxID=1406840 RepID=A0A0A2LI35_9FLAO|nr:thioredoxin family protein [Flavobacterium beibuense]KGO78853.1 thiol-disulfide isomerase [Flavobacterium beibuense F44-8]